MKPEDKWLCTVSVQDPEALGQKKLLLKETTPPASCPDPPSQALLICTKRSFLALQELTVRDTPTFSFPFVSSKTDSQVRQEAGSSPE